MAALTAVLTLADMLAFVLVDRRPGEAQCRLPELYILTAQPALLSPKAPTLPSPSPQRSWTLIVTVQQCSFVSQSASSASSNRPKARAVKGQLLSRCNSVEAGCGPSRAAPKFPPRRRLRDAAPPFFRHLGDTKVSAGKQRRCLSLLFFEPTITFPPIASPSLRHSLTWRLTPDELLKGNVRYNELNQLCGGFGQGLGGRQGRTEGEQEKAERYPVSLLVWR